MAQLTTERCPSAASLLFNLPDYHVSDVNRDDDGHRLVVITTPRRRLRARTVAYSAPGFINAPGNASRMWPSMVT